jgi:hypothetical protein
MLQYFCDELLRKIMYGWAKTYLTGLMKYYKSTASCDGSFIDFSLQKFVNTVMYVPLFPTAIPALLQQCISEAVSKVDQDVCSGKYG